RTHGHSQLTATLRQTAARGTVCMVEAMTPTGRLPARLARNTAFVVLGRLWYVAVWFAVTPFVLRHLGAERFGVWSLLFLLSGYLATFDLGLGASIVKFTAEHSARARWEE